MSISSGSRVRRGLPRGPHGLSPQEVAESQRTRLLEAMTDAAAERGYTATPVSEVIARAGVSRKTFYVHFEDRRDCLIAAFRLAADRMLENSQRAVQDADGQRSRLPAAIAALCETAAQNPGASRLQVAEIACAGQAGLLLREQSILALGALLREQLSPASGAPAIGMMGMIAGGLRRVIDQRAADGELERPQALVRELGRWIRSYHPAPAALARLDGRPLGADSQRLQAPPMGGRAPGTLSISSRRLSDMGRVSPSFTAHNQRERILDAVTNLSARKGYVALTVDEIVAFASVSLNTFYENFKDKEDAFLVALELGHMRAVAILEHALAFEPGFDASVRQGVGALLGFFASEPAFTRLAAIEAPIATRQTGERARRHLAAYAQLLLEDAPRARRAPPIAAEAIAAALHEAAFSFAIRGVIRDPAIAQSYASYVALAPFLGPGKALAGKSAAVNGRARS
jgi:AcrR family transcriptional regulator